MRWLRSGLIGALTLALAAGVSPAVTAQGVPETSFPARIIAGTCDDLEQEAAFQLADLTYGLAEEGAEAGGGAGMPAMGAPETVLVATGVTQLGVTAPELIDPAHVVAVFDPDTQDVVACGAIGGIAPEENLFFGLQEENGSGYTGVGWLNSMDDGVLLTLMLTSPEAVVGEAAMAAAAATPGALATPMATAEAAPMTVATPFPAEATPMPAEASPAVTTGAATPDSGMAQAATPAMAATPMATEEPAMAAATPMAEATPAAATPAAAAAAAETVTIEAVDIDFTPEEVSIPADTEVTIELPNNGATLHNFSLDEKNNESLPIDPISIDIDPGATEQVTVNLPAGEYYFYCNVPGHEVAGMFGTLIVG